MLLKEQGSLGLTLPDYPSSARATFIVLEEEARLREKAFLSGIQKHLDRDSQGLETLFRQIYSLSEVPPCPEFVQTFKRPEGLKIEGGDKKTIISGRTPLLVPDVSLEQLASVSGVNIGKLANGAELKLQDSGGGLWTLVDSNLSPSYPGTEKPDSDGLFPLVFGLREYLAYRALTKNITGEYPDQKTRTILDRTLIGGLRYPAVGERGEGLEATTVPDVNCHGKGAGWLVGWVKH